jgi:hypothetical protein
MQPKPVVVAFCFCQVSAAFVAAPLFFHVFAAAFLCFNSAELLF